MWRDLPVSIVGGYRGAGRTYDEEAGMKTKFTLYDYTDWNYRVQYITSGSSNPVLN